MGPGARAKRIVCVTPTSDAHVVDVVGVSAGEVVSRERIDASGREQPIQVPGCTGLQRARWSADGRRVFLESAVTCEGTPIVTSALLALTPSGDWLDIRKASAGTRDSGAVLVARYHDVGLPSVVPTEITTPLGANSTSRQAARKATGAPVGSREIIEASRVMSADVVVAWVWESGQRYAVDTPAVMELADAGVPARVIDAMVEVEALEARENTPSRWRYGWYTPVGRGASDGWDQATGQRLVFPRYVEYDPWGLGYRYAFPFGFGRRYVFDDPNQTPRRRVASYVPPVPVLKNEPTGTESRGPAVTKGDGVVSDITRQILDAVGPASGEPPKAPPRAAKPRG
jgi:hypothetical protein